MTGVDLLLYRPWSDASRRDQDEPVDFSQKSQHHATTSETVVPEFTDLESYCRKEDTAPAKKRKKKPFSEGDRVDVVTYNQQQSSAKSVSSDREQESGTPDSGFSSPSDGAYTASYHHLLPGLYQQALANQALQREAFYRDAIQREIFGRQHCHQKELQNKRLPQQEAPLALVVKRRDPSTQISCEPDDDVSSVYSGSDQEQGSDRRHAYLEGSVTSEAGCSTDGRPQQLEGEGKICRESRDICDDDAPHYVSDSSVNGEGSSGERDSLRCVAPPQTSPYHLLPPALYWPHGSTPLAPHLTKPHDNTFCGILGPNTIDSHPLQKPIASPIRGQTHATPGVMFPTVKNPLASPLGRHFSNSLTNPLTSPLTSPVARAAYDLSMAMSGASCHFAELTGHQSNYEISPRQNTPPKSPAKSPSSSVSFKRKLSASGLSPDKKSKSPKKNKATRRLNFDEDKSSPVSGTIIRELVDGEEPLVVRKGDIDPAYNVVEVTEEAKAEIAKIENKIGDYLCRLCKELYDDAFGLAQHRCSRIIHVEYRCPECDKVFNCPANLASHRRWHKPKGGATKANGESSKSSTQDSLPSTKINHNIISEPSTSKAGSYIEEDPGHEDENNEEKEAEIHDCPICYKSFKRQAYLRKHLLTHRHDPEETNISETVLQPVSHKASIHHPIPQSLPQSLNTSLLQPHPHLPHGTIMSPLSPPMRSPPFSPSEILKCHVCHATFFSHTALTIHFATTHMNRDPRSDPSFSGSHGFVELALSSLAASGVSTSSTSTLGPTNLHAPRPQYLTEHQPPSHVPSHLLHRPSQISATS